MAFLGGLVGIGTGVNNPDPSKANLTNFGTNPYASPLATFAQNYTGPTPISAPGDAYKAKDMSQTDLPQYDAMRSRLNQQYSQSQGQAQDALDRQFAAAGGGPGNGAQAKQTENLAASTEAQKSQDLSGINAEEAQTRTGLQQQEAQKEFQSGESQRQMEFGANQENAQLGFQGQQFQAGLMGQVAQLNQGWDVAQQQAANDQYNQALSEFQAKHSGGLLGGGGFLGLGG